MCHMCQVHALHAPYTHLFRTGVDGGYSAYQRVCRKQRAGKLKKRRRSFSDPETDSYFAITDTVKISIPVRQYLLKSLLQRS